MRPDIPEELEQRMPKPFREAVASWRLGETNGVDYVDSLRGSQSGRIRLIATLKRMHYFGDDKPATPGFECFGIETEDARAHAFVSQTDPLSERLKIRLPWEKSLRFKVTLVWRQEGAIRWLELVEAEVF